MTEEIPKNLRDAFHDVLANLNWRGQPRVPTVDYKQAEWAMSAICRLVDNPKYAPENVFDFLLRRLHKGAEGYPQMTYQEAARHVLHIIKRRRDDFEARPRGLLDGHEERADVGACSPSPMPMVPGRDSAYCARMNDLARLDRAHIRRIEGDDGNGIA